MNNYTFSEILQQPDMWRKEYQRLLADQQRVERFLAQYLTPDTEVVLTGAGTSAFIGDAIAPLMRQAWQRSVRAVATTDLVTNSEMYLDAEKPLLLISFARSGNSPESVAAVELANQHCAHVAHIYITCNKDGKLAQQSASDNVLLLLLLEETDDKSLAMTSSFSTMLLTCLMLGHIHNLAAEEQLVENTAKNAEVVLNSYRERIEQIAGLGFERGIFLGSGPMKGIAEECHLKLQELTDGGVVCKFDSFLGFRHGPKAVCNEKSIVVYLMQEQEQVQRYERDLVRQVSSNNHLVAEVIVCAGERVDIEGVTPSLLVQLPNGAAKTGYYALLPYVLVGQLLGYYTSLAHGLCPDTPSVSGNIHRVVEGVTIYK